MDDRIPRPNDETFDGPGIRRPIPSGSINCEHVFIIDLLYHTRLRCQSLILNGISFSQLTEPGWAGTRRKGMAKTKKSRAAPSSPRRFGHWAGGFVQ